MDILPGSIVHTSTQVPHQNICTTELLYCSTTAHQLPPYRTKSAPGTKSSSRLSTWCKIQSAIDTININTRKLLLLLLRCVLLRIALRVAVSLQITRLLSIVFLHHSKPVRTPTHCTAVSTLGSFYGLYKFPGISPEGTYTRTYLV